MKNSIENSWGLDSDYSNDFLETALALQALKAVDYPDLAIINTALSYLTSNQNPDGGWGFTAGDDSNVYMTAVVSATLQQFPQMSTIATAVYKATDYLLAHQNADGGFGGSPSTVYETSLAYSALAGNGQTLGLPLQNAVNYLTAAQSANGSWNDDPYSTALALKALYLSENKPSPPPPPPAGGRIAGTVVDAATKARVAGVAVVLGSNSLINTTTDSSGNFTVPDVPAGDQTVQFSSSGYASKTASINVALDSVASLGNVPLVSSYSTGIIAGIIADAAGKPLAGVAITVSGAWSGSAVTGSDGSYSFTYVTPGEVAIAAAKSGFQTVTGFARTTLSFSPRLSTTPSSAATGALVGRVVDSNWGVSISPILGEPGVKVALSGGISVEPDIGGYFAIQGLAPNTYQLTVGVNGFASQTLRVVITSGVTTDLGTIRLKNTISEMTLTGKVTDAISGAPIPGAELTVSGGNLTGRTDFAGTYAIADINHPSQFTLKASASGYVGKSFMVGSSAWLQTMDIALTPQAVKGSLTGAIVDATTNQPLAGASLALVSDPSVGAVSDAAGTFAFAAVPKGVQQVSIASNGYATRTLTTAIVAGAVNNVGKLSLSVNQLAASIQGTAWDAVAKAPFPGVAIQTSGTVSLQGVTAVDGGYLLDNATPGAVTVEATAVAKPGYYPARFTGALEPGGVLVFNPALSTMPPATVDLSVLTDKAAYLKGDTVGISILLRNSETAAYSASLHVKVNDPSGASIFDGSVDLALAEDGAIAQDFSCELPAAVQGGDYTVAADLFDNNGRNIGTARNSFGVATSRIAVTPNLPAALAVGDNAVSFDLSNTGTPPVASGALEVTLKDPDGLVVSAGSQTFGLGLGESKTLTATVSIPALKFGVYTLSYTQSDETTNGSTANVALPNSVSIAALFDDNSHRVRNTAGLTVTIANTGRFSLDSAGAGLPISVSVPDAGYSETKTLTPAPAIGNVAGSTLLYDFVIPETVSAGQHGARITATLPSGSTTVQTTQMAILESSLSLSPLQTAYNAGDTIRSAIANEGGVDTTVQYHISLHDAKSALIAEKADTAAVIAGSPSSLEIAIPAGSADGSYSLTVDYKDLKTGKEATVPNAIAVNGVKGALQVRTDKQNYLQTENITGLSTITNSGTPMVGGNLHLQVATTAGSQKQKTWTTQADFQAGARDGADSYGVNDWITPDDDFEAAALNTGRWGKWGNVSVQGGKVLVDSSSVGSGFGTTYHIEGDFDLQVDFSENKSYDNGVGILIGGSSYYFTVSNIVGGGYSSGFVIYGEHDSWLSAGGYSLTGGFRVTRTGNTVIGYGWSGSAWREINRATDQRLGEPIVVQLSIYRGPPWLGANSAKYDNFMVTKGSVKTKAQTADSARLLPLSENFDDGIVNADRWSVQNLQGTGQPASNGQITEASGKLNVKLTNANYGEWAEAISKFKLEGDYDIQVDWSDFSTTAGGDGAGLEFGIGSDSDNYAYIKRCMINNGPYYSRSVKINGIWTDSSSIGTTDARGKFRLTRTGSMLRTFYWTGTSWTELGSQTSFGVQPVGTTLKLATGSAGDAAGKFDQFIVNGKRYIDSGSIKFRSDAGQPSNWQAISWHSVQPLGTSIKFRTRTAGAEAELSSATWSDYLTASGSSIASPPGRWIEVEATLASSVPDKTPLLNDVTVTYGNNPGDVVWQTDVPANPAPGDVSGLNNAIGALGAAGKYYLQGTLTSSTRQTIASAEYPFYVEQGSIELSFETDKKIYKPGETVTISGEVKNLSVTDTAGLVLQVKGAGTGGGPLYAETFNVSALGSHPFSFTTTAGNDGVYGLDGTVTQNAATLAQIADQYQTSSPVVTATLSVPDSAGNDPFNIVLSLNNSGEMSATTSLRITDDSGQVVDEQTLTISASETRLLQYARSITGATIYTVVLSGDLNQTIAKAVAYAAPALAASVSSKTVADKISYNANEQATITSTIKSQNANALENLTAWITVSNSQGQALYSDTTIVPTLVQGQTITINKYWNTGVHPAGAYAVKLVVANGAAVASSSQSSFAILASSQTGAGLKGALAASLNPVDYGTDEALSYTVTNAGNEDLTGRTLSLIVANPDTEQIVQSYSRSVSLPQNGSVSGTVTVPTSSLALGAYIAVLQVSSTDATQPTALANAAFTVRDDVPPVLNVSTLADASYSNNATLNVAGAVQDNMAVQTLQINGASVPVNADGSFSYALALQSGENTVIVTATDLAGNRSADSRIITLDQTAPALAITTPSDNAKTALAQLTVGGTVDEASTVTVKIGAGVQDAALTGTDFSAEATLIPGLNTIEITATDLAGNTSSQKRTVIYDDQKPSLAVSEPLQDIQTNQSSLLLKGTATDPYTQVEVTINIDGQSYTPQVIDGAFEQQLFFTQETSYAIVVAAVNEAGSSATTQRNVIYDTSRPALTIDPVTTPTDQTSQTIGGSREEGLPVTVACATAGVGEVTYPSAATWSAQLSAMQTGDNKITATSSDLAGNAAAISSKITVAEATHDNTFSFAVFGDQSVNISGGSYLDSYVGSPASHVAGRYRRGNVGSNASALCSIKLAGGARVYGDASVGVGGSPATAICWSGGASVSGTGTVLTSAKGMTPVPDPGGATSLGALNLSGKSTKNLTTGNYRYSSMSLSGNSKLILNGEIVLHVDGNIALSGGSIMEVATGSLAIFANGSKIDITGGGIVNSTRNPANLVIYGSSALQTVNLSGGSSLYGLIFAPAAAVKLSGGQETYGSIVGNTVDMSGGASVHYPEGLAK